MQGGFSRCSIGFLVWKKEQNTNRIILQGFKVFGFSKGMFFGFLGDSKVSKGFSKGFSSFAFEGFPKDFLRFSLGILEFQGVFSGFVSWLFHFSMGFFLGFSSRICF